MSLILLPLLLALPFLLLWKHHDQARSLVLGRAIRLKVSEKTADANFKADRKLMLANATMFVGIDAATALAFYDPQPREILVIGLGLACTIIVVGMVLYAVGLAQVYRRTFGSRA